MRWLHGAAWHKRHTLRNCALRSIARRLAARMRCLTCGHALGMYSGGIVQGRPYCGTHLRAEMASYDFMQYGITSRRRIP